VACSKREVADLADLGATYRACTSSTRQAHGESDRRAGLNLDPVSGRGIGNDGGGSFRLMGDIPLYVDLTLAKMDHRVRHSARETPFQAGTLGGAIPTSLIALSSARPRSVPRLAFGLAER
jgi:hypothetical protein